MERRRAERSRAQRSPAQRSPAQQSRAEPSQAQPVDQAEAEASSPAPIVHRPVPSMPRQRSRRQGSSRRRQRRRARSLTARAELIISVSLVQRALRDGHYVQRLTGSASVFLAATLQFLTATVLELAYREARYRSRRRITPELLEEAFLHNTQLRTLLGTTTISRAVPARP